MKLKKIDYEGSARKLTGEGKLKYCLWVDDEESLYVQITKNSEQGTFSKLIFPISDFLYQFVNHKDIAPTRGYDNNSSKFVDVKDNNNTGFLKAILNNIFPMEVSK